MRMTMRRSADEKEKEGEGGDSQSWLKGLGGGGAAARLAQPFRRVGRGVARSFKRGGGPHARGIVCNMAQLPPRTGLGRAYEGQSYATWRAARDEIEENLRGTGFELPTHVTCPQGFTLELKTPRITAGTAWQGPYLTCSCPTVGRKWCYFQRAVRKKGAFGQHVWQGPPADGGAGRESREGAQPGQARAAGYAPYAVDGRGAAGNSGRKRTPTTGAAGAVGGRGLPPAAGMVGGRRHHQARVHTRPGERGGDVAVGTGRSRSNFQTAADLHYGSSSSSSSSSSSNIDNVDGPPGWGRGRMLGTRTPRSEPRDLRGPPEVGHYTPQDLLDDPDYFDPSSPFWNGVVTAEALRPGQQADIPGAIGPKVPPSKPRRFQSEEEFWAARRLEGRGGGPGPGPASFLPGGGFVPQDAFQIQQEQVQMADGFRALARGGGVPTAPGQMFPLNGVSKKEGTFGFSLFPHSRRVNRASLEGLCLRGTRDIPG
jgi:hypothetical protein